MANCGRTWKRTLQRQGLGSNPGANSELIKIRDIGTVRQGYGDPPSQIMRFNGTNSIALAISNVPGTNVVTMGKAVAERLDELVADLPIGIELQRVHCGKSPVV